MEIVSIDNECHLGDLIAIMVLLNSSETKVGIEGPKHAEMLMDVFEFNNLFYLGACSSNLTESISGLMRELMCESECKTFFLTTKRLGLGEGFTVPRSIKLPTLKSKITAKEDILSFQFDMRSHHERKKLMSAKEMTRAIKKFNKSLLPVGVGGVDTQRYLNHEFFVGDIKQITAFMARTKMFVGCDSGMSHLAGVMGMRGDVVVTHQEKERYEEIRLFYEIMYPSLNLHHRTCLGPKNM